MCEYCDNENGRNLLEIYGDSSLIEDGSDWVQFDVYVNDKKLVAGEYDSDTDCIDKDFISINFCPMCGKSLRETPKRTTAKETGYIVSSYENMCEDLEVNYYGTLEEAKCKAEELSSEWGEDIYVHEVATQRKFRTEPVVTYDFLEIR